MSSASVKLVPGTLRASSILNLVRRHWSTQFVRSCHVSQDLGTFRSHPQSTWKFGFVLHSRLCISRNYPTFLKVGSKTYGTSVQVLPVFSKRVFMTSCRRSISLTNSILTKVQESGQQAVKKSFSGSRLPKLTDVKRLFGLAQPEKWKLAGMYHLYHS